MSKDNSEFMGASFATTKAGSSIEEAFDFVMGKDGGPSQNNKSSEFTTPIYLPIEKFIPLLNAS